MTEVPISSKEHLSNPKAVKNLYVSNLLFCGNKGRFPEGDLIFYSIDSKSCAVAHFLVVTTSEILENNSKNTKKVSEKQVMGK